ncbi:hypothetical protein [Microbispora triticiradicis]|uniref:hypothetical protein n=1 Tax=Microbispora triticiradicis TaxID=2200763 RepID=UPI00105861F1|nr:hypothetical protein [Microbispora triticiradicis]
MRRWRWLPRAVLAVLGVAVLAGLVWVLGPGAAWVLVHFDGVTLTGKDLAGVLDAIRGRALAITTGLVALVAVYYTARNADTALRSRTRPQPPGSGPKASRSSTRTPPGCGFSA